MTTYDVEHIIRGVKRLTLREARTRRGLTQEELETASGVDQAVISKIERGVVLSPRFDTVCKLADGLRMDPRVLVFGVQDEAAS